MLKQTRWRILAGGLIGLMLLVSGIGLLPAADNTPNSKTDAPKSARAIIKTKFGDLEIKFYPDVAPKHVENFIQLAKRVSTMGQFFIA